MADPRINVILGAKDEASKVVTGLRGQFNIFAKDAAKGFGLQAGMNVFSAAQRTITGVASALGDMAREGAEELGQIAQLTQAIEANDRAWDGNIDAVEEVISARQRLAFSDGEQREALQLLIGNTKDLTEAQRLLATAMDFSRFRGISLRTSADLLGRAYAGNFQTLSRYGVVLKRGATATEALAAIQKMAMGQAEAYAATAIGKWEQLQIKIEDVKEDIGKALLPAIDTLAVGAEAATDPVETVGLLLGVLQANLEGNTVAAEATKQAMRGMADDLGMTEQAMHDMIQRADDSNETLESFGRRITGVLTVQKEWRAEMLAQGRTWDAVTGLWSQAPRVIEGVAEAVQRAAMDIAPGLHAARMAALRETAKLVPSMRSQIKADKASMRQAMMDLRFAIQHPFMGDRYVSFLERKQRQANRLLQQALRDGNRDGVAEAQAMVTAIEAELAKLDQDWTVNIRAQTQFADIGPAVTARMAGAIKPRGKRAHGGPVDSGQTYLVGEQGPELLHMGRSGGYVQPNAGRSVIHTHVYLDRRQIAQAVDEGLGDSLSLTRTGSYYRSA